MKIKLKEKIPPKPRGLLIYDASREIDTSHPLYNEIMLYGQQLEEAHILVCIARLPTSDIKVVNLSENVFVYYVPGTKLFFAIDDIWPLIKHNMIWNKVFRPHFILNFSIHAPGIIGLLLAKKYRVPFIVVTTGAFLDMSHFSQQYFLHYILVKGARSIIVSGARTARLLANRFGIPEARIGVVPQAIDLSYLERPLPPENLSHKYPQHNFFLITQTMLKNQRDIDFVLTVFSAIVQKYPRVALIFVVPGDQVRAMQRIISDKRSLSLYVYPEGDDLTALIGGAHLFLSISESEETSIEIVRALTLRVPVVTTKNSFAEELFAGSRFESFMTPVGDTAAYIHSIARLIEDQQVRDEYRLNASVLLQSLKVETLPSHVTAVIANVIEKT